MRRALRITRWVIEGLVLVVLLLAALGYAYGTTDHFRRFARDRVVALLATTFRGEVTFARLEGSPWGDLALADVAVRSGGETIAEIPRVHARFSLLPLALGRLRIASLEVERPVLHVAETERGTWNLLDALASRAAPEESRGGMALAIEIEALTIRDGDVTVVTRSGTPRTVRIAPAVVEGSLRVLADGIVAAIDDARLHVVTEGVPPLDLDAALTYRAAGAPASLQLRRARATTPGSEIEASAHVTNLDVKEKLTVREAKLTLVRLAAADLRLVAPTWKPEEPLTGELTASGSLADLRAELDVAVAGAKLHAAAGADVLAAKPRTTVSAELAALDVAKVAGEDLGAGVVDATARAELHGTALADASGEVKLDARDLRARRWQIGTLAATAKLGGGHADVDGRLETRGGSAALRASADLAGTEAYRAHLVLAHLDPEKAAPGQAPMRGNLNLEAWLEGTGFAPERVRATATVTLSPSRLGPVEVRAGRLEAIMADRRVRITRLGIEARSATVRASGEIPLEPKGAVRASYEARVADLSPWLALAEQTGGGSVSLVGTAGGTLERPTVRATAEMTDVALGTSRLARGTVRLDLASAAWPLRGRADAELTGLHAGVALERAEARVRLAGTTPERATIELSLRDAEQRRHALAADVAYAPPRVRVQVRELSLQAPDGRWTLARPAELVQEGKRLSVRGLRLAGAGGSVALDGSAGATGAQKLDLAIDDFPLDAIRPLIADLPELHGKLGLRAALTGTAAAPRLALTTKVRDLRIAEQAYAGLDGRLDYDAARAVLELRFDQDAEHRLTATGTLPLAARWDPAFEAKPTGDVDLALRSSGLSLAFLEAFAAPDVQRLAGKLTVDVSVHGPLAAPRPSGTVALEGGRATIAKLGIEVSGAAAEVGFDASAAHLQHLLLRADEGRIEGSGDVSLQGGAPDRARLRIGFTRWPAIATPRYQATLDGSLSVDGTAAAPVVGGRIELSDVKLMPDIAFLTKQPTKRDPSIVVVSEPGPSPSTTPSPDAPAVPPPKPDAYRAATIDVTTVIHRNSWIKHPSATVELEGEVRARKEPQRELALVGEIRTVRGWGELQGKRFTVADGRIQFTGGTPIDPALDVTATYKKGDYTIDAIVGGTSTAPSLKLASDPALSQADILAVLLFGKPASELSNDQSKDLKAQAQDIAASYAATAVGNEVARAMGLEGAGVQVEEVSPERVTLGKYVTEKTYVTASQGLQGERSEEFGVEYQFRPHWGLRTSTTSTGSSGVDVIWRKRY